MSGAQDDWARWDKLATIPAMAWGADLAGRKGTIVIKLSERGERAHPQWIRTSIAREVIRRRQIRVAEIPRLASILEMGVIATFSARMVGGKIYRERALEACVDTRVGHPPAYRGVSRRRTAEVGPSRSCHR